MNGFETEEARERHVAALVRELHQAEAAGDEEWVAAVKRSLENFGQKASTPVKRAEKRPRARRSEKR